METSSFDYDLPAELIAQEPLGRRSASRLLVVDACRATLTDERFENLPALLRQTFGERGPLVIVNRSRVYPARVRVRRRSGARGEVFVLETGDKESYSCLLRPQKKLKVGEVLLADGDDTELFRVETVEPPRVVPLIRPLEALLERFGEMPLPPYIVRDPQRVGHRFDVLDKERYQTVYSQETGSAAATTAGLHFTPEIIAECEKNGCTFASIILHVGLGTFQPVQVERIDEHPMHAETFSVPLLTARLLADAIAEGRPVVFVGTTSLRAVESFLRGAFPEIHPGSLRFSLPSRSDLSRRIEQSAARWHTTSLFLRPDETGARVLPATGHAIVTNFHGPRTTLTMLVSALVGFEFWRNAYAHAVHERYRFLSYGDSSLLLFSDEFSNKDGGHA